MALHKKPLELLKWWLLASVTLIPIMLILLLPLSIYNLLIRLLAKRFKKDLKSQLTAYDSIFAVDNFYSRPFAGNMTILYVEGYLDIQSVRRNFGKVLSARNEDGSLKFERLSQVPVSFGGYWFWKDFNVDLERHVRKIHDFGLEMEEEKECEDVLNSVLGGVMEGGFVKNAPLWEVLLLNGFKGSQSVLVLRVHHTLADGYSFNHLVDFLIGEQSSYLVKQEKRSITDELNLALSAPALFGTLYKEGLASKRNFYTKRKKQSSCVLSMTHFDLKKFKQIRRYTKTHFATVGMTLMTGALRKHFLETKPVSELPQYVSIMHSLPKPNHPLNKMVNHWGVGFFKVPICVQDPLDRLVQAEVKFGEYMKDQMEQLLHFHMPMLGLLPRQLLKVFFNVNFGTSMGFTSVPAFEGKATLWGEWGVVGMGKVFGLQWGQTAVATALYTHNGQVSYTMYANREIVPDQKAMDRIVRVYLHDEFDELFKKSSKTKQPFA